MALWTDRSQGTGDCLGTGLGRAEALAESTKVVGLWFLRTNLLQ